MKETWNQAEISEDIKPVTYVNADSWNAAELNEAINLFGFKYPVDTWNPAELDEKARNIINDITSTKTVTGNPISFKTINGGYAKSCEVTFSPIQSGSGEPSPENIRPISGWDGLSLTRTGKNLSKPYTYTNDIVSYADGIVSVIGTTASNIKRPTSTAAVTNNFCTLLKAGTYKPSLEVTPPEGIILNILDSNGTSLSILGNSFTIAQETLVFARVDVNAGTYNYTSGIQIEIGQTATQYEPYQDTTHTATFPDTVYGGSHEFVSGKVKSEWGYIASYNGETITEPWISSIDVYVAGTTPSTGAEVCYKLATPQEITLTPETIELLKGNNVLWTDGDSIELKYTKLALPDDSDGLSLNQKVRKAIEIIKGKAINEELKKEETKKSTPKGRRKKS